MSNTTKIWIRAVVLAAIVAWPTVETCRLWATQQQLEKALALERSVQTKLEAARAKKVQVAGSADAVAAPATK
jgi:hypothetical protein